MLRHRGSSSFKRLQQPRERFINTQMLHGALSRVDLGYSVCERLLAHPLAFKIPAFNLDIFTVRDFLNAEECAGLIQLIDRGRQPSRVLGEQPDPEYRTSESCNLDPANKMVGAIEVRIDRLLGIAHPYGETVQGQRYAVGQQFKLHHDFFFSTEAYWEEQKELGGQRTWTAMIFLNQPDAGGQTFFPHAGVKVTPRTGNLLTWNNLDATGEPNTASLHQGLPVEAGFKYVVTKWYRERPWAQRVSEASA